MLAVLGGCATETVSTDHPPEAPAPAPVAPRPEPKQPILGLEYGNRSTRATLQIDLGNEDIEVAMSGSPSRHDATQTAPPQPPTPAAAAPVAKAPAQPVAVPDDSGAAQARRIVDSAAARPARAAVPDSVTRRVVGDIRKAQEAFYKGRYQETYDLSLRSIAIHPTPEGCALAGSAAWVLKDKESARKYWLQARSLDPDFPGVSAMLESISSRPEELP
jgi:hypothetical protein